MESASQNIGSDVKVSESLAAGVVSVSGSAALPATDFGLTLSVQVTGGLDASVLISFLAAKIGGPVPAEVAAFLEAALKTL